MCDNVSAYSTGELPEASGWEGKDGGVSGGGGGTGGDDDDDKPPIDTGETDREEYFDPEIISANILGFSI